MVYPVTFGMTFNGPWGISGLGRAVVCACGLPSGHVAAAAGLARMDASTGAFLSFGGSLG